MPRKGLLRSLLLCVTMIVRLIICLVALPARATAKLLAMSDSEDDSSGLHMSDADLPPLSPGQDVDAQQDDDEPVVPVSPVSAGSEEEDEVEEVDNDTDEDNDQQTLSVLAKLLLRVAKKPDGAKRLVCAWFALHVSR